MKFKIQGEDNEREKGDGLIINLMGKHSIKEYVDKHIQEIIGELSKSIELLNGRMVNYS